MRKFLTIVRDAGWRTTTNRVPRVWAEEYREALSGKLVRIGFGGSIELTDEGKAAALQTR